MLARISSALWVPTKGSPSHDPLLFQRDVPHPVGTIGVTIHTSLQERIAAAQPCSVSRGSPRLLEVDCREPETYVRTVQRWERQERSQGPGEDPVRFSVLAPAGTRLSVYPSPAVSPDGRRLVFVTTSASGRNALWIRRLDSTDVSELAGTEGAEFPFWSPDSHLSPSSPAGN